MNDGTGSYAIDLASISDWPSVPLIYEADAYEAAAAAMRENAAREIAEFLDGDRLLWLARLGGQPIGTIGLVFRGRDAGLADGIGSANISRLHVVRSRRRAGVGTALMSAAEQEARRRRFERLTVEVEADNGPARGLYELLGFEYVGQGHDAANIALEKRLL